MKTFDQILNEQSILFEATENLKDVIGIVFDSYVEETGDEDGENFDFGLTLLANYADELPENLAGEFAAIIHENYFEDDEEDEEDEEFDESIIVEKMVKIDNSPAAKARRKQAKLNYKKNKSKIKAAMKKYRKSAGAKMAAKKHAKLVKGKPHKKGFRVVV